jgi:ribosomal 30S subunit maturation factor RimM
VAVEGREVLIPFVPEICRTVDVQAKRIGVTLPDGLLEL